MRVKRPESSRQHLWFSLLPIGASLITGFLIGLNWDGGNSESGQSVAALSSLTSFGSQSHNDGWSNLHIHYGNEKGLGIKTNDEWFAQVRQDQVMVQLIGKNGYFIDLAANDAVEFSNTLALENHHGWNGLCVEPNPRYWYRLAHRKCTVVGALVGGTDSEADPQPVPVQFRGVFGGRVDTMDSKMADRKKEPKAPTEYRYMAGMAGILERFQAPKTIDYLSLDVEGAEFLVMEDFPFDQYTIRVLTVERPTKKLKNLLESKGYIYMKDLVWWGETLWAHKSTGFTVDHPKIKAIETELNPDDVRKQKEKERKAAAKNKL